jgi:hypothetical protein
VSYHLSLVNFQSFWMNTHKLTKGLASSFLFFLEDSRTLALSRLGKRAPEQFWEPREIDIQISFKH